MLLEVRNAAFGYNGNALFENVKLSVQNGDLVVISGPSGSGKSSFLRLLNRLYDPVAGDILFEGKPLASYDVVELRRRICYLQQTPIMVEGTVKQNMVLSFSFRSAKNTQPVTDEKLVELLRQFKLTDISLTADASTLSVGQKQRLAFIRALLLNPKVLLLDEPTSALDPESRSVVEAHIQELTSKHGLAVIMITHIGFTLAGMNARRYVLDQGRLKEYAE